MIPPCSALRFRIVFIQILMLLAMAPGELLAVQIAPNPNPDGNTITIIPSTPAENLVPFTNAGAIIIQPSASLSNASRFETVGGFVSLLEGSQFNNLASGRYSGFAGSIGINGTFVNEGAVEHVDAHIVVGENGQYIQRQAVGSNVTPTTITPSAPFTNAGRVHIAAGDFSIDPISIRGTSASFDQSSTGTTQVDARFQNLGGRVSNAGAITIGASGEYRQQNPIPGFPSLAGSTNNTGTFTNAGTTNINTGVFTNQGSVVNSGTFSVGTTGTYNQTSTSAGVIPTTVNTGIFTSAGTVRIGEGTGFNNGTFIAAGTTNINAGVFENKGDFRNNRGQVNIGEGALFSNIRTIPAGTGPVSGLYLQEAGGTTRIDGGFDNRGSVSNEGTITVGATGTYTGGGTSNAGLFQNEGRVTSGFLNTGRYVQLATGTTEIGGLFATHFQVSNAGAITIGTTGQYLQERVPPNFPVPGTTMNSGTFTNAGTVLIGEGTSFSNFSDRGSPVAQYLQQASGTTQINGTFQNAGARVENAGAMTVGTTGTYLQAFNKFVPVVSTTVNIGTFTNAGSTLINGGTFTNHGSMVNSGTFQIGVNGAGTLTNQGTMVNAGTVEVGTFGQVAGTGSYVQNAAAAQTIVNGTFAHNISLQAGSLSGTGIITGAVMNTGGVVQPGSSIVPGTLTMANYTQGIYGRLDLKIGGLLAGSQYDVLKVTGPGTFGGSLSVRLINGFTPGLGNRFDLLTCSLGCSGLNGGTLFSGGVSLPSLASGLAWVSGLTDGGTGFSFTVVAAAASAPEPGMLLLVGSGLVGLIWWRRRQRVYTIGKRPGLG